MAMTWIAEQHVVFVQANGIRADGRIAVGLPVQEAENTTCTVALDGVERSYVIAGDNTLQALLLALQFLGMRLHDFLSRGGRVLYRQENSDVARDEDVALSAIFGPLLRTAPTLPE